MVDDFTMQAPLYCYYDYWKGWDSSSGQARAHSKTISEWFRDRMNIHLLDWLGADGEDKELHSAQNDFLAASDPSDSDGPFCSCNLDNFWLVNLDFWDFCPFHCPSQAPCSVYSLSCFPLHPNWGYRTFCVIIPANTWQKLHAIAIW